MIIDVAKLERKRARDRAYQARRRAAAKATKFQKPTQKPLTQTVVHPVDSPQLTNHIAILIDKSGSMSSLRGPVVEQLNKQVANIKQNAYNSKQKTQVSVYSFSGVHSLQSLVRNAFPESIQMFTTADYYPTGQTALLDSMNTVCENLLSQDDGAKTTSFLMIVLTDGQENNSVQTDRWRLKDKIQKLQGTDRWTFALLMPPGNAIYARELGIPEGNITEWEATKFGLERASFNLQASTGGYYNVRSQGLTSTKSFFTTDLSTIKSRDLNNLADLTADFKRWPVKKECAIADFVQQEHGRPYEIGKGFYQLTKPEKIQAYKQLVIEDRASKKLHGGDEARRLIGVPTTVGSTTKVTPGNHANFNLFVQSTSMNRKLVRGTTLLYKI
jgi:hypothetical protein